MHHDQHGSGHIRQPVNKLTHGLIILLVFIVLAVGVLIWMDAHETYRYTEDETRSTMTEGFATLKTVSFNGVDYRVKPAVTTVLIAGIDKPDDRKEAMGTVTNYRNGGQADFLLLVAIDHTDRKIYQLQIDRDTMAEIDILGIFGNETGTRTQQICLAHYFGATPRDNAKYTLRAINRLLQAEEISSYFILDYGDIAAFNDAIGGVRVRVPDDMSSVNPEWTAGKTVFLQGADAESFVRSRMSVGDGTNASRMVRQKEYMQNAIAQIRTQIKSEPDFASKLMHTVEPLAVTNMNQNRIINEITQSANYEILPVDYLDGTYAVGEDGFIEFHMQENSACNWVLDHLYTVMK